MSTCVSVCVCAKTIERVSNHIQIFWGQLWGEEMAALGVVKLSVERCMNAVACVCVCVCEAGRR